MVRFAHAKMTADSAKTTYITVVTHLKIDICFIMFVYGPFASLSGFFVLGTGKTPCTVT